MGNIINELQQELINFNGDILSALRKAHVIASRLKLEEFDAWITSELNGYSETNHIDIPDYRKVKGELYAYDPDQRWIPVVISNNETQEFLCVRKIGSSISEIIELYSISNNYFIINYPANLEREIDKMCSAPFATTYSLRVNVHILKGIVDKVVNYLLEWTIKLENEGISGEDIQLIQKETTKAKKVSSTINNYYGSVTMGEIKHSQVVLGDDNEIMFNYKSANDLIQRVKEIIENEHKLDEDRITVDKQIAEVESKIAAKEKLGIIKEALIALKDFLIGTGANVAGQLILEYLQKL